MLNTSLNKIDSEANIPSSLGVKNEIYPIEVENADKTQKLVITSKMNQALSRIEELKSRMEQDSHQQLKVDLSSSQSDEKELMVG